MEALLLIDVQNDFMPGGSLAVPNGDEIVQAVNKLQSNFDLIVATQDWHPEDHVSFASNHAGKKEFDVIDLKGQKQVLWPKHCVQDTKGADFHPFLKTKKIESIFRKGTNPSIDSYSAFYDNAHEKSTGLAGYLKEKAVDTIYFCGLAADICIYHSINDALDEGFNCVVVEEGVKALNKEDYHQQMEELKAKKVVWKSLQEILNK